MYRHGINITNTFESWQSNSCTKCHVSSCTAANGRAAAKTVFKNDRVP